MGINRGPGLTGMLREMFRDEPGEMITAEEVDRKLLNEEAEGLTEEETRLKEEEDRVTDPIEVGSEREKEELAEAARLERSLYAGVAVLCGILLLVGIFLKHRLRFMLGVLLGGLLAESFLYLLGQSVRNSLLREDGAVRYMRRQAGIRYALVFLVLCGAGFAENRLYPSGGHALLFGTIFGLLTVKPAAFLYPLAKRFQNREKET